MQPWQGSSIHGSRKPERPQPVEPTPAAAPRERHPADQMLRLVAIRVKALQQEIDELTLVTSKIQREVWSSMPDLQYLLLQTINDAATAADNYLACQE